MLIRFTKSCQPNLWINPDQISVMRYRDEDKDNDLKSSIQVVFGSPSDYPLIPNDVFMAWAKNLEFEFDDEEDCRTAFKMLQDCMGGSFSI